VVKTMAVAKGQGDGPSSDTGEEEVEAGAEGGYGGPGRRDASAAALAMGRPARNKAAYLSR
jgi:hypothetical protein